jgi:hypothetical protein
VVLPGVAPLFEPAAVLLLLASARRTR